MVIIVNFVPEIYSILFRYRRCRCRTLLYLPCIFRLRTETIWVSATLRILIAETLHSKSEVGRSPFPSRDNQYDIPRSTILFCKIMQASAKPCRVFSCIFSVFSCFSCLHQPNLRSPSYVMIMPVQD